MIEIVRNFRRALLYQIVSFIIPGIPGWNCELINTNSGLIRENSRLIVQRALLLSA